MTDYSKSARKITWVLFIDQCLASAAFIATATLNAILGAKLGGSDYWSGTPTAVYLLGAAFAASIWSYFIERIGRRTSMTLGLLIGAAGGGLILLAIRASSIITLLAGMLMLGTTNSVVLLGRFGAAEVNPPESRGRAISLVVWGGTFGAVFGPLLVAPMGNFVTTLGMDQLAGAYLAASILFTLASVVIFIGLRPDPRDLGREVAALHPQTSLSEEARSIREILSQPAAFTAVTAMVLGQVIMVALMVITSRHMDQHHHGLGDISLVIQSHTIGMYAFAVVSGYLVDKWGRRNVILAGAAILLFACISAPISPDVLPLRISLFFLGLGWNFCFVGGTTLLSDQISPAERSRMQGFNDLLVGLASASASLTSGVIFAATSYTIIAIVAGSLSIIPLLMSMLLLGKKPVVASA